jgi:two-component system chemotaxis response regulator CheB
MKMNIEMPTSEGAVVRVLIVDDAAFMRRSLRKLLSSQSGIEVVGEAVDGCDAIKAFQELRPDVVCLDVDMPKMDGVTALKHIMTTRPTPTIIVSSMTDRGDIPFETLRLGAIDFFPKPSSMVGELGEQIRHLLYVVRNSHRVRTENIRRIPLAARPGDDHTAAPCHHLLAVAGTLGSVGGLIQLLTGLHAGAANGLAVVTKLPLQPGITTSFLDSIRHYLGWGATRVEDSCRLRAGTVYFFPPHSRVRFADGEALVEGTSETTAFDDLFVAVAEAFGERSTPILLAGDHSEGLDGLAHAHTLGSRCFVQDEATALYRDWSLDPGVMDSGALELFDIAHIASSVRRQLGLDESAAAATKGAQP